VGEPVIGLRMNTLRWTCYLAAVVVMASVRAEASTAPWQLGTPIVTYWAGPGMTDRTAQQMAEGGWNLVWCSEKELDVVARNGLRGQLQDALLAPGSLEDPVQRKKLDELVSRVRQHPALYSYFITDEPNATNFPGLGKLVAYLRERDPAHLAYINLFPTYASNEQLGNKGDKISAYEQHLLQYVETVKPALVSYDHYQFTTNGDSPDYFLNLSLIRRAAQNFGLPFLNIVQACTWAPSMRVPTPDEMRFLVYTTLAYGAQGISYYVYCWPGHTGGIANPDGTPTPIYDALKTLNRDFVAIASQLKSLKSIDVYHAGMMPPGSRSLPTDAEFRFDPTVPALDYRGKEPVRGLMLGTFGPPPKKGRSLKATHALIVNLDYKTDAVAGIQGSGRLEVFNPATAEWTPFKTKRAELQLVPGGGKLVRVR
jgi:hypothetical protein